MRILVSDTSVIIDMDRGGLLETLFSLPFEFAVPDLLYRRELEGELGERLRALGLRVEELSPAELTKSVRLSRENLRLSTPDVFALALAEGRAWTLLTGDGHLRTHASAAGVDTHGVLWLFDQLEARTVVPAATLHDALSAIAGHPRCRLPKTEIRARLTRYRT